MKYTTNAVPPPGEQEILRFQKNYQVTLPDDYIVFLQKNNGGVPIYPCFDTRSNSKMIKCFIPQMDDPGSDPGYGQYAAYVTWSQVFFSPVR